jgi:putative restriction endonuclease
MAINLVVAITDGDWFEHLRVRSDLTDINFWSPSGRQMFRALKTGELFLFKLHSPRDFIVGGGIFGYATSLPCSLAWEAFEDANGAGSLDEMRRRIIRYRNGVQDPAEDFSIGCRILTQPFFLQESDWIPVPSSWSKGIQRLKRYGAETGDGRKLWDAVQERTLGTVVAAPGVSDKPRFGPPATIRPRYGQGGFRVLVTDIYSRKCVVTRERTLPALEAAHIKPYRLGGEHDPRNGLLLRRDIHALFDAGYVTVTPEHKFEVSQRIREEFENGREYYALHGRGLEPPTKPIYRPDDQALTWHNENIFKAA